MTWDTVQQLVRIILQLVAGWLLSRGWITEEMSTTLVGSLLSLAGIAWWAFWNTARPDEPKLPSA
jgi:hypothetical protein